MGKLPGFMFYPGDWVKEPNLRRCSHAAKGVWIQMLCFMFECEERGILATAGQAWTDEEIARAVGGDQDVALSCLHELVAKGVAGRNKSGAVYCRRMVRDEELRKAAAERQRRSRQRKCHASVTPSVTPLSVNENVHESGLLRKGGAGENLPRDEWSAMKLVEVDAIPPEFAREIYLQVSARDWVDGAGHPITNWRNHVRSRWIKRQAELAGKKKHKPPNI